MKKFLAVCLALILVISAGVLAFAQGGFVSSPSGNEAPEIEEVIYEEGSCEPDIIITAYSDRDTLDEEKREDLNEAYDDISKNEDLTAMCPDLSAVAAEKGIPASDLAVSDLFDISVYHNLSHDYCGSITIKLSAETIKNFVALLHRNSDGTWEVISDVVIDTENNTVTFAAGDFSPFAIVVDKNADDVPYTGANIIFPAIAMVVSGISLIGILISLKKKKQEA